MKYFIVQFKGFSKILNEDELRLMWNSCGFPKLKAHNEVHLSVLAQDLYDYEEIEVNILNASPLFGTNI